MRTPSRQFLALRGAFLVLLALPVGAAEVELSASVGIRVGGQVDSARFSATSLDATPSYGLTFDIGLAEEKFITVLWSHQSTSFTAGEFGLQDVEFDLDLDYLHVGGMYRPTRERYQGFVVFSVGATWGNPQESGFDSDLAFSVQIGGGVKVPIKKRLAFRFDARGYLTFTEMSFAGLCGGQSCSARISGSGAFQFEALFGLTYAF